MLSKEEIENLKNQYIRMNSLESQEYTKKVLLEMGKYIEQSFQGVEFELKARFKSEKSFYGKVDRLNKNPEKGNQIYDNVGFCLIVKSVSDDFDFDHKLCSKMVNERTKVGLKIDNEKSSLKLLKIKYENAVKTLKKSTDIQEIIKKLEGDANSDKEIIELLKDSLKDNETLLKLSQILEQQIEEKVKIIETLGNEYYSSIDNKINEMIATHIMNKFMDNKSLKMSLGLEKILGKTKNHDGGKSGYYIAYHDAVKSTTLDYWMVDLHAMSYKNYRVSQLDHSMAEGKERKFPRIDEEKFREMVLKSTPRNLVYQKGLYENGKEIVPGKVYECSDVENVAYFYTETLKENPDTFEYVISDNELFKGVGNVIVEDENTGNLKTKEIQEDGMEI